MENKRNNIAQPHDHLLKELLSNPKRSGILLRERLPAPVARFLSAKPPRLRDVSFVDAEEGWRPYLLDFRFLVLDLGVIPDRELSGDRRLRARLLAMKYATRKTEQLAIRERLIEVLKDAPEDLLPIIHYLISAYVYDEKTLRGIIREVKPEEEEKMMSQFAQDIRRKALHEGMQQGRREGLLEGEARGEAKGEAKLLLRILPRRFGPLSHEITDRIHGADPNTIESWADRVLDAKSLDDVFSG
uniref:Transposase, YhgA-like n=2 Tax=Candidatus Kentrum sp. SD TaxID=2126332 RepID=A0A451BPU5_9GAMM|nr:MAG: Putative transposase, YhgA-like [Candidatus Kentron sp. SD]